MPVQEKKELDAALKPNEFYIASRKRSRSETRETPSVRKDQEEKAQDFLKNLPEDFNVRREAYNNLSEEERANAIKFCLQKSKATQVKEPSFAAGRPLKIHEWEQFYASMIEFVFCYSFSLRGFDPSLGEILEPDTLSTSQPGRGLIKECCS